MHKLKIALKSIPPPLLLVLLVAGFLRLIFLDRIPINITGDEMAFIANAKAIFFTGHTIMPTRAEFPHILISPIVGLLPLSLFAARLPYIFISLGLVLLLYLITFRLVGKQAAFWVGLAAALNPWSIFFGRTAYEAPVAVTFYVFAFYILLRAKSNKVLLALIPFVLAFYSYAGTKLIFIPFVLLTSFFTFKFIHKSRYLKQYLFLFGICLLLFSFYIFILTHGSEKNRVSEVLPSDQVLSEISNRVNDERRLSINSRVNVLFSNKFTVFSQMYVNKYIQAFSVNNLFLTGEGNPHFSYWYHGYFYYLDFILIFLGIYYLFHRNKPFLVLLFGIFLISPLPSVIYMGCCSYALRASLMNPFLIILVGCGICQVLDLPSPKRFKAFPRIIFLTAYTLLVINFIHLYFFRIPIYNSEGANFGLRVLSKYLSVAQKNQETLVITEPSDPEMLLWYYLFFTDSYNRTNASTFQYQFGVKDKKLSYTLLQYEKISYRNNCPKASEILTSDSAFVVPWISECNQLFQNLNKLTIPQLSDGGTIFYIYGDKACTNYNLGRYTQNLQFDDFKVENLSDKDFCEKFITRLN